VLRHALVGVVDAVDEDTADDDTVDKSTGSGEQNAESDLPTGD
jgi:hypothetical protein